MKLRRWPPVILTLCALALSPLLAIAAEPAEEAADKKVIVYYFHGDKRCRTCRAIEANTEEALQRRFSEELDSGMLEWKVVNFDRPDNEHYLEDFGLYTSSVVVVEMAGEKAVRHETLQEVWSLVHEKAKFFPYVTSAVRGYLE